MATSSLGLSHALVLMKVLLVSTAPQRRMIRHTALSTLVKRSEILSVVVVAVSNCAITLMRVSL
jgi:hypothetical protein